MTKLSMHIQVPSGGALDFARAVRPPVIKVMFGGGDLRALMEASPESLFIVRHYSGESPHDHQRRAIADPLNTATGYFNQIVSAFNPPVGIYFEIFNEMWGYGVAERSENGIWVGGGQLEQIDRYQATFADLCLSRGYGAVLGNCGTGNLEGKWYHWLPSSVRLWRDNPGRVLWGWHEYVYPTYRADGASQPGEEWHGLRHRRVVREMVNEGIVTADEARRLYGVITEFGTTLLRANPPRGDMGYQRLSREETGGRDLSDAYWQDTLLAYDAALADSPQILGCTVYMTGSEDRGTDQYDWRTFDVLRDPAVRDRWITYARETGAFDWRAEIGRGAEPRPITPPPTPSPPQEMGPIPDEWWERHGQRLNGQVTGVMTADTGRDISDLINAAARQHGIDPAHFLAGAIAESNLHERAVRERAWPDVSYGLYQPAVKWLRRPEHPWGGVPALSRAPDGTVHDTPDNRRIAREFFFDAARAIAYAAPHYRDLLNRWDDPLEAWSRYNKPNIPASENPNAAAYARALEQVEQYRVRNQDMAELSTHIIDLRGKLPTRPGAAFSKRLLGGISSATYHFTASDPNGTVKSIAEWQISDAAAAQFGGTPAPAICYTGIVRSEGWAHWCHDLDVRVWHSAGGWNGHSVGFCYIGNGPPNSAQITGLARLHVYAERLLGRLLTVRGHKDNVPTGCPGGWPQWRPALVAEIERLRRGQDVTPAPTPTSDLPREPVISITGHLHEIWHHSGEIPEPQRQIVRDAVDAIKAALRIP